MESIVKQNIKAWRKEKICRAKARRDIVQKRRYIRARQNWIPKEVVAKFK